MTQPNLKNKPNSSMLKEARLNKGLTLEIVHESTKIPMDALRAIEDGYSTRILTPFYYRGFIKIYAEFLELNVNDVLKEYNVQASFAKTVVKKPVPSIKKVEPKGPGALEQFSDIWRQFWTPKTQRNLIRILVALVVVFVLVKMVGCVADFIKNRPPASKVKVDSREVKSNQKDESKNQKKSSAQDQSSKNNRKETNSRNAQESIIPNFNSKVTLVVHATRDSWIQVRADGKVVFQMTMKKGTMESWEASNNIELSGKNLSTLDLEINGKEVGRISSFSRNAKRVLITKDGLSVKK